MWTSFIFLNFHVWVCCSPCVYCTVSMIHMTQSTGCINYTRKHFLCSTFIFAIFSTNLFPSKVTYHLFSNRENGSKRCVICLFYMIILFSTIPFPLHLFASWYRIYFHMLCFPVLLCAGFLFFPKSLHSFCSLLFDIPEKFFASFQPFDKRRKVLSVTIQSLLYTFRKVWLFCLLQSIYISIIEAFVLCRSFIRGFLLFSL